MKIADQWASAWKTLKKVDIEKILISMSLVIFIPAIFYYAERRGGSRLFWLHYTVATIYLFTSVMIVIESTLALFRRYPAVCDVDDYIKEVKDGSLFSRRISRLSRRLKIWTGIQRVDCPAPPRPIPRSTLILAAYLPNEQVVIFETLEHILKNVERPEMGLEVIVAYNTPKPMQAEKELEKFKEAHPEIDMVILSVKGSKSKAENVNAALKIVTGEVTAVLDADHHIDPLSLSKSWRWLEQGYDVVQGRNVIRNHSENLLTKMVAVEFETVYALAHPAKSLIADTSIFGGSNGFWRTSVLKKIGFNPIMLTEDIDASIRTLLSGFRITHDRSIIATELAPLTFTSFWVQRRRWAQGWLEVTLKYQHRIWKSAYFTLWQKFYWTYLLVYREAFVVISLQIYPIILSYLLLFGGISWRSSPYLWTTTLVTILCGFYQTAATMKVALRIYPLMAFTYFAVFNFFFATLKNMISVVATYNFIIGHNAWIVTPRETRKENAAPVARPTEAL